MNNIALLVIDVQHGLDDPGLGRRNNPEAEDNIATLISLWRERSRPVIHVKHNSVNSGSPLRPELPGNAIKKQALPLESEPVFPKTVNSAFIGTDLENYLHKQSILSVIIVGLTTDHCISTTVRMAANLGFEVTLISDATATHERTGHDGRKFSAEEMHNVNLASLNGEFCTVRSTREIIDLKEAD